LQTRTKHGKVAKYDILNFILTKPKNEKSLKKEIKTIYILTKPTRVIIAIDEMKNPSIFQDSTVAQTIEKRSCIDERETGLSTSHPSLSLFFTLF
jgi:hypothetical protein